MATLEVVTLSEAISALPNAVEFLPDMLAGKKLSTLITCLGFEERCLNYATILASSGVVIDSVIILTYSTNEDDNAANKISLTDKLSRICVEPPREVAIDGEEFSSNFHNLLSRRSPSETVLFDISVAANRAVLKAMACLMQIDVRLMLLYSEADKYYPTLDDVISQDDAVYRTEDGVDHIEDSNDYPGAFLDNAPDHVVIFPSFRKERSIAVAQYVDPAFGESGKDNATWMIGVPSRTDDQWRVQHMIEANGLGDLNDSFHVSTFDYKEAIKSLERVYFSKVGTHRISIASTGSKMQALGVALFCYCRPDVKVIYAVPRTYNAKRYSEGVRSSWCIPFDDLRSIRYMLDKVDCISIKD
jgi:hypothetical protein